MLISSDVSVLRYRADCAGEDLIKRGATHKAWTSYDPRRISLYRSNVKNPAYLVCCNLLAVGGSMSGFVDTKTKGTTTTSGTYSMVRLPQIKGALSSF